MCWPDVSAVTLMQTLGPVIQWVIIIGGWIFVSHDNNSRENRKELRKAVDDLISRAYELQDAAVDYYTAKIEDGPPIAVKMKRLDKQIMSAIDRAFGKTTMSPILKRLIEVRKATTGGDFETAKRPQRNHDDPLLLEIMVEVDEFVRSIEEAFRERYPGRL